MMSVSHKMIANGSIESNGQSSVNFRPLHGKDRTNCYGRSYCLIISLACVRTSHKLAAAARAPSEQDQLITNEIASIGGVSIAVHMRIVI